MTPEEQARAKEICEKATPGPSWHWYSKPSGGWGLATTNAKLHGAYSVIHVNDDFELCTLADRSFIAESRDLLPKALAEIEKLQARCQEQADYIMDFKKKAGLL